MQLIKAINYKMMYCSMQISITVKITPRSSCSQGGYCRWQQKSLLSPMIFLMLSAYL